MSLLQACKANNILLVDNLLSSNLSPHEIQEALAYVIYKDNECLFDLFLKHAVPLNKPFAAGEFNYFEGLTPLQSALKNKLIEESGSKILTKMLNLTVDLSPNYIIEEHYDPPFDFSEFSAIAMIASMQSNLAAVELIKRMMTLGGDPTANRNVALAQSLLLEFDKPKSVSNLLAENGAKLDKSTSGVTILQYLKRGSLSEIEALLKYNPEIEFSDIHVQAILTNPDLRVLSYFMKRGLTEDRVNFNRLLMDKDYQAIMQFIKTNKASDLMLNDFILTGLISFCDIDKLKVIFDLLLNQRNVRFFGKHRIILLNDRAPLLDMLSQCENTFNKSDFNKKRLQLLSHYSKRLSTQSKHYFLLTPDCSEYCLQLLSNDDLLMACERYRVFHKLSEYFKFIASYRLFNQNHIPYERLTYLNMFQMAKRAAHFLGISEPIIVKIGKSLLSNQSIGQFASNSLEDLIQFIDAYILIQPSPYFKVISEALKYTARLVIPVSHGYQPGAEQDLYERFKKGEMVYIPTGWLGHTFCLLLYKNYVVVCNRGDRSSQFTVALFKLNDSGDININHIGDLINNNTAIEMHLKLQPILTRATLIKKFRNKNQKHGTCTFANLKSMIGPMLTLLSLPDNLTHRELINYCSNHSNQEYKDFTRFIRDTTVDEIIENMQKSIDNALLVQFYAKLLSNIAIEKYAPGTQTAKAQADIQRIVKLHQHAPDAVKHLLYQNSTYLKILQEIQSKTQQFKLYHEKKAKVVLFPTSNAFLNRKMKWNSPYKTKPGTFPSLKSKYTQK